MGYDNLITCVSYFIHVGVHIIPLIGWSLPCTKIKPAVEAGFFLHSVELCDHKCMTVVFFFAVSCLVAY